MTVTLDLPAEDMATLQTILRRHVPPGVRVWAFGSRVAGGARPYSDLDLALESDGPVDPDALAWLRTALSESDLAIKVDLVDLQAIDPTFRRLIEQGMVPLAVTRD